MKIRKVEMYYNEKGIITGTKAYYTRYRDNRYYEGSENLPKTVALFIMNANECKTIRTIYGCKTDVYTA